MKVSKVVWAIAILSLLLAIAACGGNNKANNGAGTNTGEQNGAAVDAAEAEAVYKQNCVGCHAVDLAGKAGPNLQKVGAKLTTEQIHTRISNGGGGMPAYKDQLSKDEIDALTNWLAAKK
ncbi:cytochrome c [Paenibacillus sp. J5C_2022]|uniref:c-type cytochrome n=1 Tax=Paenibacillus sp. J5C2022 TaxID=2977129 RepID=UPI0021CDF245|nr:cytochrome c [Paenibacillus sp. J5C2022]MCU6711719.1 cytochrome c [Paenibacillus sp. J5C2022]